jgi:hypothetical protein
VGSAGEQTRRLFVAVPVPECLTAFDYRTHVTQAGFMVPGPVQPMSDCAQAAFGVESVCLYESELCREGAAHNVLERRNLQRAYGQLRA